MTWAAIAASGRGRIIGYRLTIEGWPHVWVTDKRITFATNKDGREVYTGLQFDGLRISEKLVLRDCKLSLSGITARIKPSTRGEDTLTAFTRKSSPIALLAAPGIPDSSDTAFVCDGGELLSGVYHVATEAIRIANNGSVNTAERQVWDTQPQAHRVTTAGGFELAAPVYATPPTCHGRRATLHVYGHGDSMAGDGTFLWRGVVSRAPRLASDGITWEIGLDPITRILDQDIAANEDNRWHVRGIYHSDRAPFGITIWFGSGVETSRMLTGHWETTAEFYKAINDEIADILSDAAYTRITGVSWARFPGSNEQLFFKTGASAPNAANPFGFKYLGSPMTPSLVPWAAAIVQDANGPVMNTAGPTYVYANNVSDSLAVSTPYQVNIGDELSKKLTHGYNAPWIGTAETPGSYTCIGQPQTVRQLSGLPAGVATATANPVGRIYLDGDISGISTGDAITFTASGYVGLGGGKIELQEKEWTFDVIDAPGSDYIEIDTTGTIYGLFLTDQTEIRLIRSYGMDTTLDGFQSVVAQASEEANSGDTPFVNYADMEDWTTPVSLAPGSDLMVDRTFLFSKPISFLDVVTEEAKGLGLIPRISADGRYDFVQIPDMTANPTAVDSITDSDILPPARGMDGGWPGWSEIEDGIVTTVKVRLGYDGNTAEYDQSRDFTVRDATGIALHKNRGRGQIEIAPYSTPAPTTTVLPSGQLAAEIAAPLLTALRQEYAEIRITVPIKFIHILIGDVVNLTAALVPDGSGGRGVVGAKAFVVGRSIALDPADGCSIDLTLWVTRSAGVGGYTASAVISSQVNTSGNIWTLTFGTGDGTNLALSPTLALSGITTHMVAGDQVKVVQWKSETPTEISGSVASVAATSVSVALDSAWTPGADEWFLEWLEDTGILSDNQEGFTYIADENKQLYSGQRGRYFV